jgi:4-phospho-D-threonate 3-dehydrogenase / 4-phospho-D-erythronate 3-dehydrogenase
MESKPILAITMGDAAGVGPEIIVKALTPPDEGRQYRALVIGDSRRLEEAAEIVGSPVTIRSITEPEQARFDPLTIDCIDLRLIPPDTPFGQLSAICGEGAFRFLKRAILLAIGGRVAGIVTAPLNKEALHLAGHNYPGHTEILAALTGSPEVSLMLVGPTLRVIHVTAHIGLIDAVEKIEPGLVFRTIQRGRQVLLADGEPKIAVCGINPHAGEHGLFGRGEEETKIVPAIADCCSRGWQVEGPLPADTVFYLASKGRFDLVVAMYHDQGHGPFKLLGIESGVNVTVGLPILRTSVDHGTAFDIAGTGQADPSSLFAALDLAADLAG